jgi:hypothetical protein
MAENTVTIALAPCTYQDGMVIVAMGWKPIATRTLAPDQNAKTIWEAAERMHRDYDGNFDGKVTVFVQGKKPRGYDALVKSNLHKLECHRAPVWDAV